jgi:uncharacterized protein GlcG (DUF336 family)
VAIEKAVLNEHGSITAAYKKQNTLILCRFIFFFSFKKKARTALALGYAQALSADTYQQDLSAR